MNFLQEFGVAKSVSLQYEVPVGILIPSFEQGNLMIRFPRIAILGILLIFISAACSPQVVSTPVPVDSFATKVAFGVISARSQTALAMPTATETQTPTPTNTATSAPTPQPVVVQLAQCWFGPGPAYNLESNIKPGEIVELLAVGSIPGWYIIRNPYFHQPCWIQAENLEVGTTFDPSPLPRMTPLPTRIPIPTVKK